MRHDTTSCKSLGCLNDGSLALLCFVLCGYMCLGVCLGVCMCKWGLVSERVRSKRVSELSERKQAKLEPVFTVWCFCFTWHKKSTHIAPF